MQVYSAAAFVQSFTRFACRYGIPKKVYIDAGSQLVSVSEKAEIAWTEVKHNLDKKFSTGLETVVCSVGGHNEHGMVERSIKEIKRVFFACFRGLKIDVRDETRVLTYETAFASIHFL